MNVDVQVIKDAIPQVKRTIKKHESDLAKNFATAASMNAKRFSPKRTGNLARSIHVEKLGPSTYATVADTQHQNPNARAYAHFVEYGTRKMNAEPFMLPAYVQTRNMNEKLHAFAFGRLVETSAATGRAI